MRTQLEKKQALPHTHLLGLFWDTAIYSCMVSAEGQSWHTDREQSWLLLFCPWKKTKQNRNWFQGSTLWSWLPIKQTANNKQRTIHHLLLFTALWHAVLNVGRVIGKVQASATGAVLWEENEHVMNLLLWGGEWTCHELVAVGRVLHWCMYKLYQKISWVVCIVYECTAQMSNDVEATNEWLFFALWW